MGTVIIGFILISTVVLIIHRIIKSKKIGKSNQCRCDCSRCGGRCYEK